MKSTLYFLLLFCTPFFMFSQTNDSIAKQKFDSIKKESKNIKSAKDAIKHHHKLLKYSKELALKRQEIIAHAELGRAYVSLEEADSALYHYDATVKLSRALNDRFYFVNSVVNSANIELRLGNLKKVTSLIYEAKEMLKDTEKDKEKEGSLDAILGEVYKQNKEKDKALDQFKKALQLVNPRERGFIMVKIAGIMDKEKETDSILYYYNESLKIFKAQKNVRLYSKILTSIGSTYTTLENFDEAEKYYLEAKKIQEENHFYSALTRTLMNLAGLARHKRDNEKQLAYLVEAEKYLKNSKDLQRWAQLNYQMMTVHAKLGNLNKESFYINQYLAIQDSIYNTKKAQAISEIETQYQVKEKDAEIKYQKVLVKAQKKQKNIITIATIFGIGILSIALFMYRQRLKAQKELYIKQEELNKEKINNVIDVHKIESIKAHITGQNEERKRIAKDLHDGIGGNLAAIKMKMEKLSEMQSQEISTIIQNLENTYDEVRTISHNLVPDKIELYHFTELIKQLIEFSVANDIKVSYEFFPKEDLNAIPEDIQLNIYRIIQELLTNINKHSDATSIFINLTMHENNMLNLMVEDNGKGFSNTKTDKGIGIMSIEERVATLRGNFAIESNNVNGTTTNINIPI